MTRRAAVAVVVLLAWVAGSTIGSIAGLPAAHARTPGIVFGRAHGGYTPDPTGRRTITILAIGSDARPGQNPLASRADSIHVIFLHPRKQRAVVVGIPRDSWVSIPGLGTTKINAAMSSGGPARMVQTVEQNFGARIDYWAVTSFWGITRMFETIGGLQVRVPFRMQDRFSGVELPPWTPAPPRGAGPGVRPRSAQRARRGLRPTGERGSRLRGRARPVQEGVPEEPEPAPHVDRGRRAEHGIQPPLDELVDLAFAASRIRSERREERGPARRHGQRGRALGGAAVDGDGAGDLRRREGGRCAAPGKHPAEPDRRRRMSRLAPLIRSDPFRSPATSPR